MSVRSSSHDLNFVMLTNEQSFPDTLNQSTFRAGEIDPVVKLFTTCKFCV